MLLCHEETNALPFLWTGVQGVTQWYTAHQGSPAGTTEPPKSQKTWPVCVSVQQLYWTRLGGWGVQVTEDNGRSLKALRGVRVCVCYLLVEDRRVREDFIQAKRLLIANSVQRSCVCVREREKLKCLFNQNLNKTAILLILTKTRT